MILQLKEAISLTAAYYRQTIPDEVLLMYVEDLMDLPTETVVNAYNDYRKNPKNKSFPLPSQIRDLITPVLNNEEQGREISARIQSAIVKYGYANPTEAQNYIGPIGWKVVSDFGGWSHICENHGLNLDPSSFQAQCRERAKDLVKSGASLEVFDRPQLESKEQPKGLQSSNHILKNLLSSNNQNLKGVNNGDNNEENKES